MIKLPTIINTLPLVTVCLITDPNDFKLKKWEDFYNFNRPYGAFNGKTPYETMFSLLKN